MAKKRGMYSTIQRNDFYKYFFVIIFVLLAFLSFIVLRPFMNTILASAVVAYVFYLPYKLLNRVIPNKTISALIVSLVIILLLLIPVVFLLKMSTDEAQYVYLRVKQKILSGELVNIECPDGVQTRLCRTTLVLKQFLLDPDVQYYLKDILSRTTTYIVNKTSEFILSLPQMMLEIAITFFIVFYLLKDGPELTQKFKNLIPMTPVHQGHVYAKLKDTAFAVLYGSILIAAIQGALGALGFWVVGIKAPWLWGIVMIVFALIPFVGTTMIWLPAGILLIVQGLAMGEAMLIWKGIGLIIYGIIIVSSIDNVLKPKIIGSKAGMHPVLILLGVLGGLAVFGFAGFLIGPMILAASKAFLDLYEKEKSPVHDGAKTA